MSDILSDWRVTKNPDHCAPYDPEMPPYWHIEKYDVDGGGFHLAAFLPEKVARLIIAAPELLLELHRLSREVGGILRGFELEIREAIGNTNFAVLQHKVMAAEDVIAKTYGDRCDV